MHHWGDEEAGISEARRVLAPGGRFVVIEQFDPGKPWGVDEAGAQRIASMMQKAGFADVEWTKHRVGGADEAAIVGRG
jgi:ubiquinone/menaquinone biosynthesis C-methylase UbiE